MRTLFFILFFVLGFCYIQARGQKPAHVIITAGQSNTDGRVFTGLYKGNGCG